VNTNEHYSEDKKHTWYVSLIKRVEQNSAAHTMLPVGTHNYIINVPCLRNRWSF